ncbi:uncharacterized protein [Typha angustifolia]|uniref:uncharacterized protein n=1 Tax=Typha angustifolia TaxID=59011 RepID=UPI003C30C7B2
MLFRGLGSNGGGGGAATAAGRMLMLVRSFSRKRSPDLRRINPKVPKEEATTIAKGLHQIFKDHGPLSVSNTWNYAKDAGIDGLNSKTHMKIMLKWMTGRQMLKLSCSHIGSAKKFFYSTPEDSKCAKQASNPSSVPETTNSLVHAKNKTKKSSKRKSATLS